MSVITKAGRFAEGRSARVDRERRDTIRRCLLVNSRAALQNGGNPRSVGLGPAGFNGRRRAGCAIGAAGQTAQVSHRPVEGSMQLQVKQTLQKMVGDPGIDARPDGTT
jgi:hypothetical protein